MKKVNILMSDLIYSNNLCKMLNSKYSDIEASIISSYEEFSKDILLITDQNIDYDFLLDLSDNSQKYQRIENIYELIIDKYSRFNSDKSHAELITFVNLYENLSSNSILTELAKLKSAKDRVLLINYNNFHKYDFNENELGLETILFSNTDNIEFNKDNNLYYLNSSNIPLQTNKLSNTIKIVEILNRLSYKKIMIDLCFNLNESHLHILNKSNKIIFYIPNNSNIKYINSIIKFLKNNLIDKNKIFVRKTDSKYKVIIDSNSYEVEEVEGLLEYL